ncbi:hypothetical protein [Phyllobacterium zundukense]|jgi:hypothetical protein|uniref:Uncharacterized protein n=1 Tax=Phyllobacterium zundukense TaxID=1867719 RepID=A0ACD4D962_9HYPH|nr:hypothetical protein [Phyllobacterium zundukense]UXN62327.1 hypothetical protein N8E88_20275 [Phyllobacterium zundukense]
MEPLKIFRLLPIADEADPRWDNADNQGEVIVRARSAADARVVAAEAEDDFLDMDVAPADGDTTRTFSAFRDDKLYTVVEDTTDRHPAIGARAVVEGNIRPVILSTRQADR